MRLGGDCVEDLERLQEDPELAEGGNGYQPMLALWAEKNVV